MSNLVEFWFNHQLKAAGYDVDDIRYRFDWSQGDGVAWYGTLYLPHLVERLLSNELKGPALKAVDKGIAIEISKSNVFLQHDHWNTMVPERSDYVDCEDLTPLEHEAVEIRLQAIKSDVVSLSQKLESDAYSLVHQGCTVGSETVVRTFKTRHFALLVERVPDADINLSNWGPDLALRFCRDVIEGRSKFFTLKVTVQMHGLEISSSWLGGCAEYQDQSDRTFGGNLTQLVKDAVTGARSALAGIHVRTPAALQQTACSLN